ncbi:MAG: NAD-dependent epimerase/dehydratase family protein [Armatimonadetes bacterium]|nr:NAD-dependent epimerase/dehydratase family protein [Armatimonadota bacterium]
MKILVTGGAGFIGSHVVDACLAAGHQVWVLDNLSSGHRENLNPGAEFVQMDILDSAVEQVFKRERFNLVSHHAAQIDVRKSVADPAFDARVNVLGGLGILSLCARYGVRKVIYASTGGAIYGIPRELPAGEDHPIRPLAAYGVSKHCLEHYIELFSDLYGLEYTILRYANVYGPRQDPHGEAGVVAIFIGRILSGTVPAIYGDGEQTRDYVYVADVARANLLALDGGNSQVLNIGTGVETSVNELYRKILRRIPTPLEPRYSPPRDGEVSRISLGCEKASRLLGWSPEVPLDKGLAQTVEYFREVHQSALSPTIRSCE